MSKFEPIDISVIDFFESPLFLGIKTLSPAQKIILKVIAGEKLDDSTPIEFDHPYCYREFPEGFANEVEYFKWLSGKDEYIPGYKYNDVTLCVGRRGGKTSIIAAGLALYQAVTVDFSPFIGTSPAVTFPIISPTKTQSNELYGAIKNFCLQSPYIFSELLNGDLGGFKDEYLEEDVGSGANLTGRQILMTNKIVFKMLTADVSSIRGFASGFATLDESAWMGIDDSDNKNSDLGIFQALQPSLAQFGDLALILKISSPNGQSGLMYEDYVNRKNKNVLHIQAPTWHLNPNIPVSFLEKQKERGMNYFLREYGAQYTSSENSYLDNDLIEECIIRGVEELDPNPKYKYVAAMDYATKNDLWAFCIAHKEYVFDYEEKEKKERVIIDYATHWKGKQGAELDPSEVIPQICNIMKKYQVGFCLGDHYAYAALRHFFQKEGCNLKEFKVSSQSKNKYMFSLQIAVNSRTLRMVHNPVAVKHLKDLREKRTKGNNIKVEHASGCHDDYADVIALCVYQFDKSSPVYIGLHTTEDEDLPPETKDKRGNFYKNPTAMDIAEKAGIPNFYDNRKEVEARLEKEKLEKEGIKDPEKEESNDLWFIF